MRIINVLFILILTVGIFLPFAPVEAVQTTSFYIGNNSYAPGEEVIEKRTENSKTTYLGKVGSQDKFSVEISGGAIHYKDNYSSNEQWKDIDLTPVNGRVDKAPYILVIDGAKVTMTDKRTGSVTVLELTDVGSKKLSKPSLSSVKGKASKADIDTDTDLEITWTNSQVKMTRVLKSSKASTSAKFNVSQTGNGIKLDYKAEDSSGDKLKTVNVNAELKNGVLTESIDAQSLTYPVRVDPTLDISVGASSDDCWVRSDGGIALTGTFDFGSAAPAYSSGARFTGVTIASGMVISTAYLILTAEAHLNEEHTVRTKISAEQSNAAATFSTYANFIGRVVTTEQIDWDFSTDWVTGSVYNSAEIKTVIQELVDDYTGLSNAQIAIFVKDDGSTNASYRTASSYDVNFSKRPILHIEYTLPIPIVTTQAASLVEETTATGNGNITNLNSGGNATIRGIEYDTDTGAPYANEAHSDGSYGTGAYTTNLTSLTKGELYYARAYATNPVGTGYGSEVTFLTKPDEPTGLTATAGDTKVDLAWTVGAGSQKVSVRALKNAYPAANRSDGTEIYFNNGTSYSHTGLTNGDHWFYRAWSYATEGGLTQYSDAYEQADATPVAGPVVTTADATSVEETTATAGGNITDLQGGANVTERGVEYDTNSGAPYASNSHEHGSWGISAISQNLATLTKGELYYFRAYAINPTGTGYGTEKTFLTKPDEPTAFTATAGDLSVALAWTRGTGYQKTMVRYRTDGSYPTSYSNGTEAYFDTAASYNHTGLTNGTTYKYRMWTYATEGGLIQYSDTYAEATATPTAADPVIDTLPQSLVTSSTARLNAEIVFDGRVGGGELCQVTFVYFAGSPYLDYAAILVAGGTEVVAAGTYTEGEKALYDLSGLTPGVLYSVSVKAVNSTTNPAYGSVITFTTATGISDANNLAAIPTATTVSLAWVKGLGSQYTLVRYSVSTYPITIVDGTAAYLGTGNSYMLTGLTAGTTYYFSAWGKTGVLYASGYATAMATTLAFDTAVSTGTLETPPTNSLWNQTPSTTKVGSIPLVSGLISANATAYAIPEASLWYFLWVLFTVGVGVFIYAKSGNNLPMSLGAQALLFALGAVLGLVMLWIMVLFMIIGAGFSLWGERR
jgi:hypothetical protein